MAKFMYETNTSKNFRWLVQQWLVWMKEMIGNLVIKDGERYAIYEMGHGKNTTSLKFIWYPYKVKNVLALSMIW